MLKAELSDFFLNKNASIWLLFESQYKVGKQKVNHEVFNAAS